MLKQRERQHSGGLPWSLGDRLARGVSWGGGEATLGDGGLASFCSHSEPWAEPGCRTDDALVSTHPPFTPTPHTLFPSPRARPRALGFPQSHSCLHSSCQ